MTIANEIDAADLALPKRPKYGNRRTQADGIWFDSAGEARRYQELTVMQTVGAIAELEVHPRFVLQPAFREAETRGLTAFHRSRCGAIHRAIVYEADFSYCEFRHPTGDPRRYLDRTVLIVEDVKARDKRTGKWITTPVFQLKRAMLLYQRADVDFRLVEA